MTPEQQLRDEFNRWAQTGRGAEMEKHHLGITEKTIQLMGLRAAAQVEHALAGTQSH